MGADFHIHLPKRDDPDHCGREGCARHYSHPVHAPSEALRRLSEMPPDLRPLEHHERASGAPYVPVQRDAAPATHTGRPAMHPGTTIRVAKMGEPQRDATPAEIAAYLKANPHLNQDPDLYCSHPNGFGPNGCPCGKGQPGEDDPETVRNIDTGEDVPATRCPECQEAVPTDQLLAHMRDVEASDQEDIDAMAELLGLPTLPPPNMTINTVGEDSPIWGHQVECPACANAFIKGNIRRHLQTVHSWNGDQWDDWAESVNFLEMPSVPKSILDEMEALGKRVDAFLDPDITMEQIMSDAQQSGTEILTEWWLKRAAAEAEGVVPKSIEYGSNSLMQLGRKMAQLQGREVSEAEALELGCWANCIQKIERWTDAVMRGERPSDDTILDAGVYLKMVQRIRDSGSWPGV
jgi:hypothetical protein